MQRKAMVNLTTWILIFFILITFMLQFSCSQENYPNVSCIARERRALLQFRNGLVDGSNWLSSWSGEDCCNWKGIGCNKNTGHVVKLDLHNPNFLSYGGFQGEINPSLLVLKNLNYLDLSMNNFSGIRIPVFFGSLKELKYLNLSRSGFMGNIPHHLGNLSQLQHLDLQCFDLTAESISWLSKLSYLRSLDLSSINLSRSQDWLQAINMLPSLKSLKLNWCHLEFLPNLLHVNITSLTLFELTENEFNSTIPIWLFNMTSLKHLDLSENYFHGLIPDQISQLTSLASLYLSHNRNLISPLPKSLASLSSLHFLHLRNSNFGGLLPLGPLCNLTSLVVLNLDYNKFQGSIPKGIGCFTQLVELSLSHNELNGEISEVHFEKLTKLKYLILASNSLTLKVRFSWIPPFQLQGIDMSSLIIGPRFPSWLQTQKNLKFIAMRNASISDDIPSWFETVHSQIHFLDLSSNNITGKVPTFLELSYFSNSRAIILSSNNFETMSNPFASDIDSLLLSRNLIAGPIPIPVPNDLSVSTFSTMHLNDNYFSGSIPDSICHFRKLRILDLSNNQLSGRLPLCLGNLQDLLVLKVTNNSLSGQIPSSLGNIEFLQSLRLSKNKFNGKLPQSMEYLIHMQFLDLGENEFEGTIPSLIGEHLSNLRILRLKSNHFSGNVPLHLCQLSKLQILNLAQNSLTGFIPNCFHNFSAMASTDSYLEPFQYGIDDSKQAVFLVNENILSFMGGRELEYYSDNVRLLRSLDISQNNIIGEIPNKLMDLVGLRSLNLSRNHLSGSIPEKIGNLKQLLSLDLSMNEFSGSIPPCLGNLNFLSYLNLSSNKLSGRIPMGNQLQTLIDPSIYAGNNGLCGEPLSNSCSNDKPSLENEPKFLHKDDNESSFLWFYAGLGPGFTVGLLGIFCIFVFKKSWCVAYFQFVENFANNIGLWIVLSISKLQRKLL